MTTPDYPFDSEFRWFVEEQSDWWGLINATDGAHQELLMQRFADAGYSKEQVRGYLEALKEKPIDELVYLALRDDSDESPALIVLQQRTTRDVFDEALRLCASNNPKQRVLGVQIMMRQPGLRFKTEAHETICSLAKVEMDDAVLEVLAYALNHLDVEHRSHYLERVAKSPVAATRMAAAYSLSLLEDHDAIGLLIDLTSDQDGEVRNWATFGLQSHDKDPQYDRQAIQDALFARVHDSHDEARHEALLGLAYYKDPRVMAPLIEALHAESVWELAVEAAEQIAHPDLYPHLIELRSWWDLDPKLLERAITACGGFIDAE